jgi:hypothetical protein
VSGETLAPVVAATAAPVAPEEITDDVYDPGTTTAPVTLTPVAVVDTGTLAPVVVQTSAPVGTTSAPVIITATETPVVAPVIPATSAPQAAATTTAPVAAATTTAPVIPATSAPVAAATTSAPVVPATTSAPVAAAVTLAPVGPSTIQALITTVALNGGAEFNDPTSYHSKSLAFLEGTLSPTADEKYITYYSLACIWYSTAGISNPLTDMQFGVGTAVPNWISATNWTTDTDYCTWHGISCDASGNVVTIDLINNRLSGSLPAETQLVGSAIETIDLFGNFLLFNDGDFGNAWLGKMTTLKNLYYGETGFQYPGIPSEIGLLTNLQEYDCSFTYYNGPIPDIFGGLTQLTYLDLGDQDWRGLPFPPSITNLPNLELLYYDNTLSDSGLELLIGMPKIYEFWGDFTPFNSSIPTELGTVSTLGSVSLTFCGLTGPIPSELGKLTLMDSLWLYQNSLTGTIPVELGNMARVQSLYFEGNDLTGFVPDEICTNRISGLLTEIGSDCVGGTDSSGIIGCAADCCTCCGETDCGDFA